MGWINGDALKQAICTTHLSLWIEGSTLLKLRALFVRLLFVRNSGRTDVEMKARQQRQLDPFEPRDKSCKRWCHFVGRFAWRGRNTISLRSPFAIPVERWSTPGGRKSRRELFGYATRADFRVLETKRERETACVRYNFHEFQPLVYEYNGVSLKFKWRNLATVETSYDKIIRLNNRRWISCSRFDDNWQRSSFSNDTPRIYDVIL